ncbi:MAG: protein phosphatase 2C domain-containing protein [Bdellovibrionaceae bacterium]|nr:protein phosphatase 2C domain-containing protein [Bdellovibrionales bacterium]MCB9083309.1 protein phosphatase 2C domain-containing protein [Pseudobdellovibrionaceae bacterium]
MSEYVGRIVLNENLEELESFHGGWLEGVIHSSRCPGDKVENEDSVGLMIFEDFALAVVSDGLGGHKGGAAASKLAVGTLNQAALHWRKQDPKERIERREMILQAIESAHAEIKAMGIGAGTTISVAEVTSSWVRFYSLGDSFGLLMGGMGTLKFKNVEHSPVGYCLEAGAITEDDVIGHPASGVVLNALGIDPIRMEISQELELAKRDHILLASDGLTDNLKHSVICEDLRRGSMEEKMAKLVDGAHLQMSKDKGKPDDLTMVLIRLADEEGA